MLNYQRVYYVTSQYSRDQHQNPLGICWITVTNHCATLLGRWWRQGDNVPLRQVLNYKTVEASTVDKTGSTKLPGLQGFPAPGFYQKFEFFFRFSKADPPGSRPGVSASSRRANNDGLGLQLGRQKEGTANRLDSHRGLATVDLSVFFLESKCGMTGVF